MVIDDHDVFVAFAGGGWETSCLVAIDLASEAYCFYKKIFCQTFDVIISLHSRVDLGLVDQTFA